MSYRIREVAAWRDRTITERLHALNALAPDVFPPLEPRHFQCGFWWIAYSDTETVGFAGLVPFEPFPLVGYLKRAYVAPAARGNGLQLALIDARETKARKIGWTTLVSECAAGNLHSAANFHSAGFQSCEPEQRWGASNSIYWRKELK